MLWFYCFMNILFISFIIVVSCPGLLDGSHINPLNKKNKLAAVTTASSKSRPRPFPLAVLESNPPLPETRQLRAPFPTPTPEDPGQCKWYPLKAGQERGSSIQNYETATQISDGFCALCTKPPPHPFPQWSCIRRVLSEGREGGKSEGVSETRHQPGQGSHHIKGKLCPASPSGSPTCSCPPQQRNRATGGEEDPT